jgi:anti-anti-sigma factor
MHAGHGARGIKSEVHPLGWSCAAYPRPVLPGPFDVEFDESTRTLAVSGEVDESAALALRDALSASTETYQRPVVVDLTSVGFLPSVAVGVLAKAMQQATRAGHPIELRAEEGSIAQRVLQVCALPHSLV